MTILAYVLCFLGVHLVVLNYWGLWRNHRNRRLGIDKYHSAIPILGGTLGALGLYLLTGSPWAWLAALLDPGVAFLFLFPLALWKHRDARHGGPEG